MKRAGIVLVLFLAFCGLADSLYIAQSGIRNTPLICSVENLSDCQVVNTSPYARFLGIPIAWYGVAFYLFVFCMAALELVIFSRFLHRVLQASAIAGVVASAYFTFLELFVIRALCIYCLASALIALLIFISVFAFAPARENLPQP